MGARKTRSLLSEVTEVVDYGLNGNIAILGDSCKKDVRELGVLGLVLRSADIRIRRCVFIRGMAGDELNLVLVAADGPKEHTDGTESRVSRARISETALAIQ